MPTALSTGESLRIARSESKGGTPYGNGQTDIQTECHIHICPMRSRIGPVIGVKMSAIADRVEAAVGLASRCAV